VKKDHNMKRRQLPLTSLRAFEVAGRLGRISAAAAELCVTHGAISRQVAELETLLGLPLFQGSRRAPQLTDQGKALLPALTGAFDAMEEAIHRVQARQEGVVEVRCLGSFLMRWLIPRLVTFQDAYPLIDLRLAALEAGQANQFATLDVTITVLEADAQPMGRTITLFPERLGIVLAPHLLLGTMALEASDQAALRASIPRLSTHTRSDAWESWERLAQRPAGGMSGPVFPHYYFTLEAAVSGLGACVAPEHLVRDDLRAGRLAAPFGFLTSGLRYVAILNERSRVPVQQFADWLQEAARQYQYEADDDLAR
jgi:LysR family transcriptional regulator, glycine cleavage system transcriptional activator